MSSTQISIQESLKDKNLRISLIPPVKFNQRTNSNICCVVDVSGSMGNEAKITSTTSNENYKLSILDIVKHSLKMIVNTLSSDDNLSVVTFSDKATVLFNLLPMNDGNKTMAIEKIEQLNADGGTQLWAGLHQGLECLMKNTTFNKNQSVFLLTDGQPSDSNIDVKLSEFKKSNPKFNCTVNTFGFSDQSNSELLNSLAVQYNGMFSFIPDASLIATAFSNAIANTLTVFTNNALLHITTQKTLLKVPSGQSILMNKTNKLGHQEIVIDVGIINTQQTRDFIFEINSLGQNLNSPYAEAKLTYTINTNVTGQVKYDNHGTLPIVIQKILISKDDTEDVEINNHIYRYKLISAIYESIDQFKKNQTTFEKQYKPKLMNLIEEMENIHSSNDRHFDGIYKDLVRTVSEGFKTSSIFSTWGHHYLLSLGRAHLIQQCNTYKDPGVQHYGSSLFQEIRGVADETFLKMPPPKPYSMSTSYVNSNSSSSNNNSSSTYSSAYNMNDYHNYSSGGCIHGDSLVHLPNGATKKVSQMKKGDLILSSALGLASVAEIECVVISKCEQNSHSFVQLGDTLWITPKHPIRLNGEWVHPKSIGEVVEMMPSDFIYQFVLKSGHTMMISGFEVICLGHGFEEPIAKHDYLGTQEVINDLKNMKGWQDGRIMITSRKRESSTGKVTAFIQ